MLEKTNNPIIQPSNHPTILIAVKPATNFQILIITKSLKYFDKKNEDLIEDTIHATCRHEALANAEQASAASAKTDLLFLLSNFYFFTTDFKPVPTNQTQKKKIRFYSYYFSKLLSYFGNFFSKNESN